MTSGMIPDLLRPFTPAEERQCPNDRTALVKIDGGPLALLTLPPYVADITYPGIGLAPRNPEVSLSPSHYPVIAYVCPKCGLVQLYADKR